MISRSLGHVAHMRCECDKPPQLMQVTKQGKPRYYVEAVCCHTVTVRLSTKQRALNEFQRIRAAQYDDATYTPLGEIDESTVQSTDRHLLTQADSRPEYLAKDGTVLAFRAAHR